MCWFLQFFMKIRILILKSIRTYKTLKQFRRLPRLQLGSKDTKENSAYIGHKSSPLLQNIGHIFLNGVDVWEYRLAKCPSLKYSINLLLGMLQTRLTTWQGMEARMDRRHPLFECQAINSLHSILIFLSYLPVHWAHDWVWMGCQTLDILHQKRADRDKACID